jgi:hypothetical protein
MKDAGIYKAYDLLSKPEQWIRKEMGINGVRLVNELKGIPQLEIPHTSAKKSIAVTRSFMEMIKTRKNYRSASVLLHFLPERSYVNKRVAAKYLLYL